MGVWGSGVRGQQPGWSSNPQTAAGLQLRVNINQSSFRFGVKKSLFTPVLFRLNDSSAGIDSLRVSFISDQQREN